LGKKPILTLPAVLTGITTGLSTFIANYAIPDSDSKSTTISLIAAVVAFISGTIFKKITKEKQH
jgi:ABC-type thiamin/hydroxymethylpyrimidine transport system permease subunit